MVLRAMSSIDSTAGCVLQVSFELIDANDNAPRFDTDQTRIHVSEGSLPGASISLQPAEDIDSPVNGVDSYQLVDDTSCAGGAPFDLLVERNADASHDLRLVLQSPGLDRELCDQYRLTVIALDAGTPAHSVTASSRRSSLSMTASSHWSSWSMTVSSHWSSRSTTVSSHWSSRSTTASSHWSSRSMTVSSHWSSLSMTVSSHWSSWSMTVSSHWSSRSMTVSSHWSSWSVTASSHWSPPRGR